MSIVGPRIIWSKQVPYLISRKEVEVLAQFSKSSVEAMIEHLKTQDTITYVAERWPYNEMQKITDRINRRINGEYVEPAWIEKLRKK